MAKSFLDKFSPNRQRSKLVEWPFHVDGERPKVRVSVLGSDKLEAAALEAVDHFKKLKQNVDYSDPVFIVRERAAQVWHAFADEDGKPLASSVDDLVLEPTDVINALWTRWAEFQAEIAESPRTKQEMDALIDELKKNGPSETLNALSSSTLSELVRILVAPPAPLTQLKEVGSSQ